MLDVQKIIVMFVVVGIVGDVIIIRDDTKEIKKELTLYATTVSIY